MQQRTGTRATTWLVGVVLLTFGGTGRASEPAAPIEALVAEALGASPSLAAIRERLAAAREATLSAGALPPPMLDFMGQNERLDRLTVGEMGMSMWGVELRQSIPQPGVRAARRSLAVLDAAARELELELARRELAASVRQTVAALWAAERRLELLEHASELQRLVAETVQVSYTAGRSGQAAVVRAQLEETRLVRQRLDVEGARAALRAVLARLLGRPAGASLGFVAERPVALLPPPPWSAAAVASSPTVASRRLAVARAEQEVAAARLALRPAFTTGAGLAYRGALDPMVSLRFGIELPLDRRSAREPRVREAEHELAAARAELRAAELEAASEAARLETEWRRVRSLAAVTESTLLPQTTAAFDAARSAYLGGREEFVALVEALQLWLAARLELVQLRAEESAVEAAVLALTEKVLAGAPGGSVSAGGGDS